MRIATAAAVTLCIACADLAVAQVQPPQDRINTALARARQVGIPVTLLEGKIAEGKAKGVSLDRIAAAIERREATLEHASQVMKGQPGNGDAELSVAADAIDSGVSDTVLRAISESAPRERRAVAIAALTQLVQHGHVPDEALDRVKDALKRGPEALLNLPAEAGPKGKGNDNTQGPPRVGPPDAAGNRGNGGGGGGAQGGPPASVPAPGQATEPTKPDNSGRSRGGPPATPPGQSK
ncbi:MAG TPA: hypothetical protein VH436_32185 [Vicinamibacterales bacterium]|jgi:hypothetical protein